MLKLGKLPARPGAVSLRFSQFVDSTVLPQPPRNFGHEDLVTQPWDMLGNDKAGDCVFAGAAHETMMWNREAGNTVNFDDNVVLSDYSAVTGYNPADPSTDKGTDMQVGASYRRKTGVVDSAGNRHKIAAYLAITPGNIVEHYQAIYLFGAVGIGIQFPASAMQQFNGNKPWSVVAGSNIIGGHYVPLVAKRTRLECVSWGKVQGMTIGFFHKYNDESLAYVSEESLTNGKSLEGFDSAGLVAALNSLH